VLLNYQCNEWFVLFWQGNCHACTVPKSQMDNMDRYFIPRTKELMLEAVSNAMKLGRFPGWKKEARIRNDKLKNPLPDELIQPKPILDAKTGGMPLNRRMNASAKIGRNLLVTFWDDLDGVDLHKQVG
jgi:hypothetical protein